ncbi:hypothetical protein LMJF_05_0160 [Leishmania major strain Friedlin]|uniref:Uncharacterized protein n=1 Tax=Leishmania major TaxID=5664 RepID=Q4QJI7_LEIMA|nr:hypothetical protein LMJF_05_0160 [Leishmania major strain Friedlin]CAG9568194.1 hypothetical_protein_-_conserved [Leishmania major strain Friedlin]CAJ01932.1 hypothetical protein LMJF_05_0160 [Leishmania major strain Friedlin]|eukprot:XP_001687492.1 hypothetical protein LMJF_05_0160 [Leishmania major strain Friedlin]
MPIIKSRVHADELHAAKNALTAANREADALHQQVLEQRAQLDQRAQQNARLAAELVEAETKLEEAHRQLAEMQAHAQVREEHHREQVHRMAQNLRTLEDMVQASRRSEREGPSWMYHRGQSAGNSSTDDAGRARQRGELICSQTSAALQRPPAVPTRGDKAVREQHRPPPSPSPAASPPISAQALYWQEQLLDFSQRAAEGFGEVQRQLRHCLPPSPPSTSPAAAGSNAHSDQEPLATSASPVPDAYRWSRQLRRLHAQFDEVVQADSKLISFLLLVAQQQGQQIRTLQERWAEAQNTVREAEAVLDEASARVSRNAQESAVLRQECAVLTEAQTALQAQLTNRTREHQAAVAALHRLQEAHAQLTNARTRQEEMWTTRLTQAAELQQQASNYAQKLEAALLDKEQLMSAAAASAEQGLRREVLEAAKKRVAVFLRQLNASVEELHCSLASLSSPPPSLAPAASAVAGGTLQKVSSAASPEPSPPGASSSAYSASLSPLPPSFSQSLLLPGSLTAASM